MSIPEPIGPDIVEFATSRRYLGKDYLSVHQIAILKALYGLEMSREEVLAFLEMTEGRKPRKGGYQEAALICGVRSGKTMLAALIGTYESVRWGAMLEQILDPGQVARGILIAQKIKGASEARGYIEGNLHTLEDNGKPVLARTQGQEKAITGASIKLKWPIEIVVYPSDKHSVRGVTGLWFIGDEIAHWKSDEGAYNQDKQVMRAVRPRFATLSYLKPKQIMISSPREKQGVLWDEYQKRATSKTLVVKAPTWLLNPSIEKRDPGYFDIQQEKDPESFQVEFAADFADSLDGNTFLPSEIVDQCIDRGRQTLQPVPGRDYVAWMDAAFKRDRFSFGIAHAEAKDDATTVVIDHMRHWTPKRVGRGKAKPLDDEKVVEEIVADLRPYGLDRIHGDQFADVPLQTAFRKRGIQFMMCPTSRPEKYDAYKNLRGVLRAGLARLPDDEITKRDLKGLVKKETTGGHVDVRAPKRKGAYDDAATVVSRLIAKLLPLSNPVDIAALNAKAMEPDPMRGMDWRERKPYGDEADPFSMPEMNIMEAVL